MKKIKLLTLSFLSSLLMTSCGAPSGSITPPPSDGDHQDEEPPVVEIPSWQITEERFNELRSAPLKFEADVVNMTNLEDGSKKQYNFKTEVIFNDAAYSFKEFKENGDENKSQTYFKDEQGNVAIKSLTVNNEVKVEYLIYSATGTKVKFDEFCNNPFASIDYKDLKFDEKSEYITINNEEKAYSFSRRITYYGEDLNSLILKNTKAGISVYFSGRSSKYSVTLRGLLKATEETVKDVTKLEHLSYHDEIDKAIKELDAAKSMTYERVRTNANDINDTQTLVSKVTENAVLYTPDTFTGYGKPYGMAKFNDDLIHTYEVEEDGSLTVNSDPMSMVYKPTFDTIAPEFFTKVGENRYELKHKRYSEFTAGNMAETYDEATFVTQIGLVSNLFITLKDGHLDTFAYVLMRYYPDSIKLEENVVTIKNVNKTTIEYNFELKK